MKPLSEILTESPQKKAADHMMNAIMDNRALASNPPILITKKGPRNERDELFDYFYDRLAGPWKRKTGKPLRKAYLAMKISHLKVPDLHYLKSICKDAQNRGVAPSKVFWGSLKPRPDDVHN